MTEISSKTLGDAVLRVERMSFNEREQLADEVHAQQPNLFFSVLALQGFEASLAQMEVVLNLLLVFYTAMQVSGQASGQAWPVISEDVQDRGLKRIGARARATERLTPRKQHQAMADDIAGHAQKHLLAYAAGKLTEHGLNTVKNEAEKMITLATMNLVECIALTAPATKGRKG